MQWLLPAIRAPGFHFSRDTSRDNKRTLKKATGWPHSSFTGTRNPFCCCWLQVMMILSKAHFLVWWLKKTAIPPTDSTGNFCYLYSSLFPGAEWQHQKHLVYSSWCHFLVHTSHCLLAAAPGLLLTAGNRAELWVLLPLWCYLSNVSDSKIKQETQHLEGKGNMWPNHSPCLCIRKTFLQLSEQNAIFVLVTPSRFYLEVQGKFFPIFAATPRKSFTASN